VSLPIVIDWDDTLVYWRDGPEGEWIPGAKEFLKFCKRQGWKIIVASARANFAEGEAQIRKTLDAARHMDVTIAPKPLGFAYVDNRGVPFDGNWSVARERVRQLA
jgi:predicted HAD superfamily phosphohydrolase YqeG